MNASPIRIRTRLLAGDVAEVTMLMPHPMESGLRRDDQGVPVPAHFITDVDVTLDGRSVFAAQLSFAVSRDPLIAFRFAPARAGQRLRVAWTDSRGERRADDIAIG